MDSELTGTSSDGSKRTSDRNAVLECCTVVAIASELSHSWASNTFVSTTPAATTTPSRHHLRQSWVMYTSTEFDYCRLRGGGRHPAPKRSSTRLSLLLQKAPSCSTQGAHCRCGPVFSLADSSSSCSPNGAGSVGSVLPDASHVLLEAPSRFLGSQAIGPPGCSIALSPGCASQTFNPFPCSSDFVDDKRAWCIPWDFTGRCGSNSLHGCLHASNPKPLGTCWITCSAFQSLPHRHQPAMFPPSAERPQQSDEQVVPQPTLSPSVSHGSPTQSTALP